jgi:hypothetical protein
MWVCALARKVKTLTGKVFCQHRGKEETPTLPPEPAPAPRRPDLNRQGTLRRTGSQRPATITRTTSPSLVTIPGPSKKPRVQNNRGALNQWSQPNSQYHYDCFDTQTPSSQFSYTIPRNIPASWHSDPDDDFSNRWGDLPVIEDLKARKKRISLPLLPNDEHFIIEQLKMPQEHVPSNQPSRFPELNGIDSVWANDNQRNIRRRVHGCPQVHASRML